MGTEKKFRSLHKNGQYSQTGDVANGWTKGVALIESISF